MAARQSAKDKLSRGEKQRASEGNLCTGAARVIHMRAAICGGARRFKSIKID
jgi:hypothetical protein